MQKNTEDENGGYIIRKQREWYPGAMYHIMQRGVRRQEIFKEEDDYQIFLMLLKDIIKKNGGKLHAFCLMTNHYHLLLETENVELWKIMKSLAHKYAMNYNSRHSYCGHLFEGRYKACIVSEDEYFLQVSRYIHLNPVKAHIVNNPEEYKWSSYRNMSAEEIMQLNILSNKQKESLINNHNLEKSKRIYEICQNLNIDIVCAGNRDYPLSANIDKSLPILLYTKGVRKICEKTVAIVGPRRCSQENKRQVVDLVKELTQKDYAIISGMAKGVDAYAHTTCITQGEYTIAVLGNGLDICYPKEHHLLMERITENGLVISEYAPGTKPVSYNFPQRNRIIAALSNEVYVISPGKQSGALITAEYARKYKRKVNLIEG